MDAGRFSQFAPDPSASPSEANPPTVQLDHLNEEASLALIEADRNKSRVISLGIAAMVHVLLFMVLAWIVTTVFTEDKIELIVEVASPSTQTTIAKDSFAKKVTQDQPAPPSRMATRAITAASAVSPVSMPKVDTINDEPAFGTSFGTGFGEGGVGNGRGGGRFFGTSGVGNRIILVIDTSTSMNRNCGDKGIAALRKEINKTISALSASTRFNIICFGEDADGFAAQPVAATGENVKRAKAWMKGYFINKEFVRTRTSKYGSKGRDSKGIAYTPIPPSSVKALKGTSGNSRMDLALVAAFEQKPSTVFLIADGEPGTMKANKKLSNKEIVNLVEDEAKDIYKSSKLPKVNCISVKGIGEAILKDIAKRFRGLYKPVDPAKI